MRLGGEKQAVSKAEASGHTHAHLIPLLGNKAGVPLCVRRSYQIRPSLYIIPNSHCRAQLDFFVLQTSRCPSATSHLGIPGRAWQ
jgi:hypothetical protein